MRSAGTLCALATTWLLSGCAGYSPLPLEQAPLPTRVEDLDGGRQVPRPPALADLTRLALLNNPDLRAVRAQAGVAQAQALEAGLLPNPAVALDYALPLGVQPGAVSAFTAVLSMDLKSLVTFSARRHAARAAAGSVNAAILWEEWQTVARVQLLAVDLITGAQQLQLLERSATLLQERLSRTRMAQSSADVALGEAVPDVTAAADLKRQVDELERTQQQRARDLRAVLGLAPAAQLPLPEDIELPPVNAAAVSALLSDLADRRPDLVALQLGYASQEQTVRAAVLARFPALTLGVAYARDNTGIRSLGPQAGFDLPLFDRGQGNLAVARATRLQLRAEFKARLADARAQVQGMLDDQVLLERQRSAQLEQLETLQAAAVRAQAARAGGDLDERSYLDLITARDAKQQELLATRQLILEQAVALAALTGAGMPPVTLSNPEAL